MNLNDNNKMQQLEMLALFAAYWCLFRTIANVILGLYLIITRNEVYYLEDLVDINAGTVVILFGALLMVLGLGFALLNFYLIIAVQEVRNTISLINISLKSCIILT